MLALLASLGLPGLAQARPCDSGGIQYGECGTIPKVGGDDGKHPNSGGGSKPGSTSDKPSQGGGEAESPGTESESEDKGKHAGVAPGPGDDGGKGNGKGDSGGPGGGRATIGLEEERPVGGGNAAPTDAIPTSGGGSSPLIPVLIAVAVLAAISIGTVIYRGRRRIPV